MDAPERFRTGFEASLLYYTIGLIWLIATSCLFLGRTNEWFKMAATANVAGIDPV
jgi:hypothetical protein